MLDVQLLPSHSVQEEWETGDGQRAQEEGQREGEGKGRREGKGWQEGDKAAEKAKSKVKPGEELKNPGRESPMAEDIRPHEVLDKQLWAEIQYTQTQHGSAIRAIQSQMDAMTLGMAACGSLLKDAKEKVQYHASIRTGLDETAADGSKTLAENIEMITAGREQLERLSPGTPLRMLEEHIGSLNLIMELGVEFTQAFKTLADDAHRATVALGEWLQAPGKGETAGDVEMAGVEDDLGSESAAGVDDEDLGSESAAGVEDDSGESAAGGMDQSDEGSGEDEISEQESDE
ncbi:hypothetical protein EST38_g3595 [Candolleomyces aberdarensis]|uniref:Uncharacterized protein n=1 Tax=Candolleomyces aberdarensis TaxID=2316362 RepID=A0A4V1Q4I9_9AGAR|nr:hypothetical protein EST38_g3595 [Candolleomyces aberdarensis]